MWVEWMHYAGKEQKMTIMVVKDRLYLFFCEEVRCFHDLKTWPHPSSCCGDGAESESLFDDAFGFCGEDTDVL
jgi:hypothetical protein